MRSDRSKKRLQWCKAGSGNPAHRRGAARHSTPGHALLGRRPKTTAMFRRVGHDSARAIASVDTAGRCWVRFPGRSRRRPKRSNRRCVRWCRGWRCSGGRPSKRRVLGAWGARTKHLGAAAGARRTRVRARAACCQCSCLTKMGTNGLAGLPPHQHRRYQLHRQRQPRY